MVLLTVEEKPSFATKEYVLLSPVGAGTIKCAAPSVTVWLEPGLRYACDQLTKFPDEKFSEKTVAVATGFKGTSRKNEIIDIVRIAVSFLFIWHRPNISGRLKQDFIFAFEL